MITVYVELPDATVTHRRPTWIERWKTKDWLGKKPVTEVRENPPQVEIKRDKLGLVVGLSCNESMRKQLVPVLRYLGIEIVVLLRDKTYATMN